MLEFTDWAIEVLQRAHEAARRFNPDVRLRLAGGPGGLSTSLAEGPEEGETIRELSGVPLIVPADLDGLVDVEAPHDRLVLKPAGSSAVPRLEG